MRLRKEKGGSSILWHDRVEYAWPGDGDVCEVPDDLARDLLGLDGYSVAEPEPEGDGEDQGDEKDPPDTGGEGGSGNEQPPPAKPAARRSRAKPATA